VNFSSIKKTVGIAVLSMVSISGFAQDNIARQAPSDKRLKDIHNVRLNNTAAISADLNEPAAHIYQDWTDNIRSCAGSVPSNYKIDLRGFHMPTPSRKINSPFGPRWGRMHEGLDVKVYIGDTIRAAFDGKVRICKYNGGGYGYYLVIRHPNGLETLYGHLSKQLVKKNQVVRAGEPIGLGGNTGKSFGSHLHFETRVLGKPINPALMFDFVNQDVTGDYFVLNSGISNGNAVAAATRSANHIEAENTQRETVVAAAPKAEVAAEPAKTAAKPATTAKPKAKAKSKAVSYSVKSGDTLYSIARKHNTPVDKLRKLNGLKSNAVLKTGQRIKCS
jgi:murein DD-endopeptidase MepM/ murein hydrolase activator NlpD